MAVTERIGIEVELMGEEDAIREIRQLERELRGLGGRARKIELQSNVDELRRKIVALRSDMARLKNEQRGMERGSPEWRQQAREIRRVSDEIRAATAQTQRYTTALRNAAPKSLGQVFKQVSSRVGHMGAAMQSAGNAITRLTTPLRLLTTGMGVGAGFAAINKVTEGLGSGFSRYDTMKKYPRMMELLGYSTKDAAKSIADLDQSVRGLPTGLNEMVDLSQRFTMTTGDMEKGTKLAIATNNAFLASMSTDTQRYQGMMQLQDVVGGKKMGAKEWQSLANSMMPAIRMIGESLGYTGDELDDYVSKVQQGKIANEDFLDALMKAGGKGGKLEEVAQLSKDTWEAFSANIGNAFSRTTAGVIESMDEIVKVATGGEIDSVNMLLSKKITPAIDDLTDKVKGWIKAHPDEIVDFFDKLKSVDWKGFAKGFADGIGTFVKAGDKLLGFANGKSLEGIGKMFAYLQPIATGLTVGGGLIKGSRHLFGGLAVGGSAILGGSLFGNIGNFLTGIANIKGLKNADKVAKNVKGIRKITKAAGKTPAAIGATFKGFVPVLEAIAGVGLATIEIAGTAAIDAKLLHIAVDNVTGIVKGMKDVFGEVKGLKGAYEGVKGGDIKNAVNTLFDIYSIIYGEESSNSKGARAVTRGTGGGQRKGGLSQFDKGALKSMKTSVGFMKDIFSSMNTINKDLGKLKGFKGFDTGTVDGVGQFVTSLGDMYAELDKKIGEMKPEDSSNFATIIKNAKGIFKTVGDMAKSIPQIAKALVPITSRGGGTGMGYSTMDTIKNSLIGKGGLFSAMNEILTSISDDMEGNGMEAEGERFTVKSIGKLQKAMEGVNLVVTSISETVKILGNLGKTLPQMMTGAGGGAGSSTIGTVTSLIQKLMGDMNRINTAVNDIGDTSAIASKMENLKKAVNQIKTMVTTLGQLGTGSLASTETGSFVAIQNLKAMIAQIGDALNVEGIGQIQEAVTAFTTEINNMFDALNVSLANVPVEVGIDGKVTGDDKLVNDVNSAKNRILNAVRNIPTSITRSVTINIMPHVNVGSYNVPTNFGSGRGGSGSFGEAYNLYQNGGFVYRAKGGKIPKRGTDTVPAMLTPGEYTMRKRAVDYFGQEFMRRVNNMDIAGAMRALSAKAGRNSAVSRGTVINNNTTNNYNVNTNQNINTNNPNFAFKRSNRYVMAL